MLSYGRYRLKNRNQERGENISKNIGRFESMIRHEMTDVKIFGTPSIEFSGSWPGFSQFATRVMLVNNSLLFCCRSGSPGKLMKIIRNSVTEVQDETDIS